MKDVAAWIVAIVIGGILSAFLFRMTYAEGQRDERAKWDDERDSLTTALDTANARTMRSEERANYIAWQLDSARKNRPTPQQVIDRNLKAMEYAPLNSVRDTLMMP